MIDKDALIRRAADWGIALDAAQADQFDGYARLLVEWNRKMNLTALTDPEDILTKHFLDSLTLLPLLPVQSFRMIDVGTGAGFPGVVLALVRPDIRLTLLDSLNKRLLFLEALCSELGIKADRVHARAEEAGRQPSLRETFEVATARAVAPLPVLCEYCLPFVRPGGLFLAMKGPEAPVEAAKAQRAMEVLSGKLERIQAVSLCGRGGERLDRRLLIIRKTAAMSGKYPRNSAKMEKQPL